MSLTVKALQKTSAEDSFRVVEIERRDPRPDDVVIDIAAAGICHSDIHTVRSEWGPARYPVVPGHEIAGEVTAVGSDVTRFAVGDRVVSEQIVPCWECRFCKRGQYHMCQPHDLYGFKRRTPGAMASYMVYPAEALVHKVSGDIAPQHAAFAEPLSCALHGVERAQITFEDTVVVAGAIAEAIGRAFDLPVASIAPERVGEHYGWIGGFFASDLSASSAATRRLLDWAPTGPTLIEDLDGGAYRVAE